MANNCLVTKLKGSVDADLPKLGVLKLEVNNSATGYRPIGIRIVEGATVTVSSPNSNIYSDLQGTVTDNPRIISPSGSNTYSFFTSGAIVEISSKYKLAALIWDGDIKPVEIKDLKYSEGLVNITGYLTGNLSDMSQLINLTRLETPSATYDTTMLLGNISALSTLVNLTYLAIGKRRGITGALKDIGSLTHITDLQIGDTVISGSIEEFVAAQRLAGRTTCGQLNVPYIGTTAVTFNGGSITAASNSVLSWTASTITLDGTTISA